MKCNSTIIDSTLSVTCENLNCEKCNVSFMLDNYEMSNNSIFSITTNSTGIHLNHSIDEKLCAFIKLTARIHKNSNSSQEYLLNEFISKNN